MKKLVALILGFAMVLAIAPTAKAAHVIEASHGVKIIDSTAYQVSVNCQYQKAYEVLNLINEARDIKDMEPLQMDTELLEAAMLRAAETVLIFDHFRPNGTMCDTSSPDIDGEIIARGFSSPAITVGGWLKSSGHSQNIFDTAFKSAGVGVVNCSGVNYWVACFGYGEATPVSHLTDVQHTYNIDVNEEFCKKAGVNLGIFNKVKIRKIDDEGNAYPKGTVFRLYNPLSGEHLFTSHMSERNQIFADGWNYEYVAWHSPATSSRPVHRLYYKPTGEHHFTCNKVEINHLKETGWIDEGIKFYSDENKTIPVYRLYNPNSTKAAAHHYTMDQKEVDKLKSEGWIYEEIGWYAISK